MVIEGLIVATTVIDAIIHLMSLLNCEKEKYTGVQSVAESTQTIAVVNTRERGVSIPQLTQQEAARED